jgi:5-formyltetrahydrofolate cyclo-ligase
MKSPPPTTAVDGKSELRRQLEAARLGLSSPDRALRSRRICEKLAALSWLAEARGVALFWPLLSRGEVDVRPLDLSLRDAGKTVYYPFVDVGQVGRRFGFRVVRVPTTLVGRGHGFAEPDPREAVAERGDLDLVVVPALGVAPNGHRLGHGAGFYDTVLPAHRPPARAVVVAFDLQVVNELPVLEHDQACDLVVTDERCFDPLHLLP